MLRKMFFLTVLLLGLTTRLAAEPNETARFLMNDPITLMDFGMYRLEKDIRAFQEKLAIKQQKPHTVLVDYFWDDNRIKIILSYGDTLNPPKMEIEAEIRRVVARLKEKFGIDTSGNVRGVGGYSAVAEYFSHRSFVSQGRPTGIEKEIDKMVEIKVVYYVQNYTRYFECRNLLVGSPVDGMMCSDYIQ